MSDCVGIIVDGDGDFASLRARFRNGFRVLKTDGPRGRDAAPGDIAKRSWKQVAMLRAFECSRVIVMLDFEARSQPYEDFVRDLASAFSSVDFGLPVLIAVPNRMIENWYLADIEYLSAKKVFLRSGLKQRNYEGGDGKAQIKRCMQRGHTYTETRHGPQMFAILRFAVARKNSASFDAFLRLVRAH
jgi:hypothetical protein